MLELRDNQYCVAGIPLLALAEKYSTPLYVYDAEKMQSQYAKLCHAFGGSPFEIRYACKALSNMAVLRLFQEWGAGLDTVSIYEVELGILAGFAPARIIFTPNGVSFAEIRAAADKGVVVNIDNLGILEQFGQTYGGAVPCCLRFNPRILAGGNPNIQTGHLHSKFGIPLDQIHQILQLVDRYHLEVSGVHAHTGSEIVDADVFLQEAEILYWAARHFPRLRFIDFGGGFKVAYKEHDRVTDIEYLGKRLGESMRQFCHSYGRELSMWFEPGKFLVSEAGYLLVSVNVLKETPHTLFAGVDSGQNHLIRPMFYNAYHKLVNLSNPTGEQKNYTVVGYICETDNFAKDRMLPELRVGDVLCFQNTGAYGFSMSSNYNSRPRPAEVLLWQGKDHLIRKRETLEDLLRNQIF
jgi:diaminopimelate decarboxylase